MKTMQSTRSFPRLRALFAVSFTPLLLSLSVAGLGLLLPFSQAQAQDAKAGEKKVAMCIGCHGIVGYKTAFPEVYRAPKISGQNAKFIEDVLKAYAKGERKHPSMRSIATSLTDADIADIAAFYEAQGKGLPSDGNAAAVPSPKAEALLKAGACASCHGADFNKTLTPAYPKLAGQYPDYLYVALRSYLAEGHATWGRGNAVMGGTLKAQAKTAKNPVEFNTVLKETAQYLSQLPGEIHTVPQARFHAATK